MTDLVSPTISDTVTRTISMTSITTSYKQGRTSKYQSSHRLGTPFNVQMEHRGHCDQTGEQSSQRLQRCHVQSAGQGLQVTERIQTPDQGPPRYC